MKRFTDILFFACLLSGCASPPSAVDLAGLPTVIYPDKPNTKEYIYKLPADKPINLNLLVDGSALTQSIDQTVSTNLKNDIYLHKGWASEDGQHWVEASDLIGISFNLVLPSYETPTPGEIHLIVDRKVAK